MGVRLASSAAVHPPPALSSHHLPSPPQTPAPTVSTLPRSSPAVAGGKALPPLPPPPLLPLPAAPPVISHSMRFEPMYPQVSPARAANTTCRV